jgi:hypothetical protein
MPQDVRDLMEEREPQVVIGPVPEAELRAPS